jgi:hypothetical protein
MTTGLPGRESAIDDVVALLPKGECAYRLADIISISLFCNAPLLSEGLVPFLCERVAPVLCGFLVPCLLGILTLEISYGCKQ